MGIRGGVQSGQEWMERGCSPTSEASVTQRGLEEIHFHMRAGTSLWGPRAPLTDRGKRGLLGTCVPLSGRRQELCPSRSVLTPGVS